MGFRIRVLGFLVSATTSPAAKRGFRVYRVSGNLLVFVGVIVYTVSITRVLGGFNSFEGS